MSEITIETIKKLEFLTKLRLTSEERAVLQEELSELLHYMDILKSVDVQGIEPLTHFFTEPDTWREDVINEQEIPYRTTFLVPKTVE